MADKETILSFSSYMYEQTNKYSSRIRKTSLTNVYGIFKLFLVNKITNTL